MTKAELIRIIVETCRVPRVEARGSLPRLPERSPAAGGGLAGVPAVRKANHHGSFTDPQAGNTIRWHPRRRH